MGAPIHPKLVKVKAGAQGFLSRAQVPLDRPMVSEGASPPGAKLFAKKVNRNNKKPRFEAVGGSMSNQLSYKYPMNMRLSTNRCAVCDDNFEAHECARLSY